MACYTSILTSKRGPSTTSCTSIGIYVYYYTHAIATGTRTHARTLSRRQKHEQEANQPQVNLFTFTRVGSKQIGLSYVVNRKWWVVSYVGRGTKQGRRICTTVGRVLYLGRGRVVGR